jgi:WD40 repeat protein
MRSLQCPLAVILVLALLAGAAPALTPPRSARHTDLYGDPLPPHALARLGTIRLRHASFEDGLVRFTADGTAVLSTGIDGIVHFWDVATGREVRRLMTARTGHMGAMALSPDGRLLAFAADDAESAISVWDLTTGREQVRCRRQGRYALYSVALAPDGRAVAGGTHNGQVVLWELPTGRLVGQMTIGSPIRVLLYTPDGALVAKAETGQVFNWDGHTGKELRRLIGEPQQNRGGIAMSPDGAVLAVSEEKGIGFYNAVTGADQGRLLGDFPRGVVMQFSPDSRSLVLEGARGIIQWEVATGRLVQTLPGANQVLSLDISPDGRLLALAMRGGVRLYDLKTGKRLQERQSPEGEALWIAFTRDGSALAMGARMEDGNLSLWDPATGRRLKVWQSRSGGVVCRFAPDGTGIFAADGHTAIQLQEWGTGRELRRFAIQAPDRIAAPRLAAFELSPDGGTLTAFFQVPDWRPQVESRSSLRLTWDVATGREQSRQPFPHPLPQHVPHLALAPGANRLAVLDDRPPTSIRLYDIETGEELASPHSDGSPSGSLVFSPDGALLAAACHYPDPGRPYPWKTGVVICEVATGAIVYQMGPVHAWINVAFSADGRLLATGPRADAPIQLWDLATGKELDRWDGHSAPIGTLAFAPDGNRLASGQTDGTVLIWDIASAVHKTRRPAPALGSDALDRRWADLAGTDARKAQAAVWALVDAPGPALELFGRVLRPDPVAKKQDITRLIAQLDSRRYRDREDATRQLQALGPDAAPALRNVLDGRPNLEMRRRVDALLAIPHTVRPPRSAEERRRVRAVRVLERIGSPEACRLLTLLTGGPAGAEDAWQARAALARLAARSQP